MLYIECLHLFQTFKLAIYGLGMCQIFIIIHKYDANFRRENIWELDSKFILEHRKNAITILSNLGSAINLPDGNTAQTIIKVCQDFIPSKIFTYTCVQLLCKILQNDKNNDCFKSMPLDILLSFFIILSRELSSMISETIPAQELATIFYILSIMNSLLEFIPSQMIPKFISQSLLKIIRFRNGISEDLFFIRKKALDVFVCLPNDYSLDTFVIDFFVARSRKETWLMDGLLLSQL